jgi:hypothetical protein
MAASTDTCRSTQGKQQQARVQLGASATNARYRHRSPCVHVHAMMPTPPPRTSASVLYTRPRSSLPAEREESCSVQTRGPSRQQCDRSSSGIAAPSHRQQVCRQPLLCRDRVHTHTHTHTHAATVAATRPRW